jgi:MFS family permease
VTTIKPTKSSPTSFYYGWVVWVVATLGWIATAPGQSFTVSLFLDDLIRDFNLERTAISGLYGLGTFVASLSLTAVGALIDRYGNRIMTLIIGITFGLALCLWSTVMNPLGILLGFVAIRGLGQGGMTLVSSTVIAQWFRRRRGTMTSLTLVLFALFQSWYAPRLQQLIANNDWRMVWLILGIAILAVIPVIVFFMRDRPEDYGLLPDNDNALDIDEANIPIEDNWTLREAGKTFIFWIFLIGRFVSPAWGSGLILHQVSIFEGLGYDAATAANTFALATLATAFFSIIFGVLVDKLRAGWVMAIQLTGLIITMISALIMRESWLLVVYAIGFGVTMGGGGVFDGAVWANLFGRLHQGKIRGFVSTVLVIGTAVGPLLFGISYDYFGGYAPILYVGIALTFLPLLLGLFTNKPVHRYPPIVAE